MLGLLKRHHKLNQHNTVTAGAVIAAAMPFATEAWRLVTIDAGAKYSYVAEGCQAILENVRTKCGYMLMLKEVIVLAALGAAIALIFWYLSHPRAAQRSGRP